MFQNFSCMVYVGGLCKTWGSQIKQQLQLLQCMNQPILKIRITNITTAPRNNIILFKIYILRLYNIIIYNIFNCDWQNKVKLSTSNSWHFPAFKQNCNIFWSNKWHLRKDNNHSEHFQRYIPSEISTMDILDNPYLGVYFYIWTP